MLFFQLVNGWNLCGACIHLFHVVCIRTKKLSNGVVAEGHLLLCVEVCLFQCCVLSYYFASTRWMLVVAVWVSLLAVCVVQDCFLSLHSCSISKLAQEHAMFSLAVFLLSGLFFSHLLMTTIVSWFVLF